MQREIFLSSINVTQSFIARTNHIVTLFRISRTQIFIIISQRNSYVLLLSRTRELTLRCERHIVRARKRPLLKCQVHAAWAPKEWYRLLSVPVPNRSYNSLGILTCAFRKRFILISSIGGSFYAPAVTQMVPRDNALAILGCWNVLSVDLAFARGGMSRP